jgi:DNA-binding NarL/FixJ family response regulator
MVVAGAVGYLIKDEAPATIVAAVRAAARGGGWFSPSVAAWVGRSPRQQPPGCGNLTDREQAVLRQVTGGRTNKEIAQHLGIAERTVEFHISNVLRKLDLSSRVEAAIWANEHLLMEP